MRGFHFNANEAIEQTIIDTGEIKITNEFIDYYCNTYFDDNSQKHANKTRQTLNDFIGLTLKDAADAMAKQL